MTPDQLIPFLIGPGGSIAAMAMMGWAVWKILDTRIFPMAEAAISRHLNASDAAFARHSADHERIIASLDAIDLKRVCQYDDRAAK